MLNDEQNQTLGNGAIGLQAVGNITIGVTASEARNIALDVAKSTFFELTGVAKETAKERVEEITNKVIEKLEKEYPSGLQKAKDPDFQYALFTVQKEYARNGDKDLGDLLVDLIVDRSKQDSRDILQIVLNESLIIAPKLTNSQIACLSVIFLCRYTQTLNIVSHHKLGEYFDKNIKHFIGHLLKNDATYQHLEFTGCGSIQISSISLEEVMGRIYQGLFLKGIDSAEIMSTALSSVDATNTHFFIQCLNDSTKLQVNALNKNVLKDLFTQFSIPSNEQYQIERLFDMNMMNLEEIKTKCIQIRPYMDEIFNIWSESPMNTFTLTSVGIAIGHANLKRLVGGEFSNLSIWIN